MNFILALAPWSLIRKIVFAILEMVVEKTDNEYDDKIFDVVDKVINEAEEEKPDEDSKGFFDYISNLTNKN